MLVNLFASGRVYLGSSGAEALRGFSAVRRVRVVLIPCCNHTSCRVRSSVICRVCCVLLSNPTEFRLPSPGEANYPAVLTAVDPTTLFCRPAAPTTFFSHLLLQTPPPSQLAVTQQASLAQSCLYPLFTLPPSPLT